MNGLPSKKVAIPSVAAAIIAAVFALEGGYVWDKNDPGGETNHGVTVAVARANGYTGPMLDLTPEFAEQIYYTNYISKPGFGDVIALSPTISEKLIDAGVNAGISRPSVWFQTSLNALSRGGKDYPQIKVDGKVGSGTYAAYKSLQKVRGKVLACELVLKTLDAQQTMHYLSLEKLNMFTPGWIANRIGNVPLSRCKQDK